MQQGSSSKISQFSGSNTLNTFSFTAKKKRQEKRSLSPAMYYLCKWNSERSFVYAKQSTSKHLAHF
ncbi:hypothetical protein HMPREF9134_01309 [Porphyromonas catoniae F0037]|uniref:Uncharacterized protein n=1 Tax=Porphyromonas catoniae F0037 TaxID=1127696 RepID=L1NCA9_9PORP|nr:hypothetical protein HMPREF9134_01309 [Porphyromonas catoniae F0037]